MEKLYRLLIVDDEYHVVDWLAELFEGQEDLEVYKAHLAREALELLSKIKIDIVLSDIKMPGMDGFELADRITEDWPQAKIIFLTGYNEFDYAYKANQYKNVSFLLKTEDDDAIQQAVEKAVKLLEEEQRELELAQNYAGLQNVVAWQMQKSILTEWLDGKMAWDFGRLSQEGIPFPFNADKSVAVLCIRMKERQETFLEKQKLAASLQKLLKGMLFEKADIGILDMESGYFMAVVQQCGQNKIMVFLREMLDLFAAAALESLRCHLFFVLYEEMTSWRKVREKYEMLRLAAEDVADAGNLYGGRTLGKAEEEKLAASNTELLQGNFLRHKLELISELLEQGKRELFFEKFDEVYHVVIRVTSRHYYPAIEIYQYFSTMFLSWINRKNLIEKLAFKIGLGGLMNLYEFENWKEAFDYLRRLAGLLFEEQAKEQAGKNDAFLETVKQFVGDNLREDLSLTWISRQLHYNPSYISRLFKQLSGRNLSEYILEEKMDYAKRRLKESEDTVAVIAQEVGYDSSQYFSVVFRKQTGMSPGEYRHSCW